jgi:hypothetical protein
VNPSHLKAFLWLRWRIRVNQFNRGGVANAIILAMLAGAAVLLGIALVLIFFFVGLFALAQSPPPILLYVWDGLVVTFLCLWAMGLLVDLQRSESLSLDKFMHLPVSLSGAFVINYLSSLLSLSLILFVPAMAGLSIGLIIGRGPVMLFLPPLVVALLMMITAVTYQFQGWLATLLVNKRRRRTIIVLATAIFILIFQLPNLLNIFQPWNTRQWEKYAALDVEEQAIAMQSASEPGTPAEHRERQQEIHRKYESQRRQIQAHEDEAYRQKGQQFEHTARLLNLVLPPGWLPLGAMALAEGKVWPAILGTLGMVLIGTASLWRAYRTTVRMYSGQFTARKTRPQPAPSPTSAPLPAPKAPAFLEKRLPWLSEYAAVVALAGFRSLTRAPEAKMMLLSPIFMVIIFGGMFLRGAINPSDSMRPLMGCGALAMVLLSLVQLVGNQFGFDRSGFRVFVLCPARRRDILLGKNLAVAPLALALAVPVVALVQFVYPMRLDYFLALLPLAVTMYLLFCLLENFLAIIAPMRIASGSLRAANVKLVPALIHFLGFSLLLPVALCPAMLPFALEYLFRELGWFHGSPLYLISSLVECLAVCYLYRIILNLQGRFLQAREQKILTIVTTKAE